MIAIQMNAKGRGVYAVSTIEAGQLVEECPLLLIPRDIAALHDYVFEWNDRQAIALGYGTLYNHSYRPNAIYTKDFEAAKLRFFARQLIAPGEEISVNYNGDPTDTTPVWFEVLE